MSTLNQASIDAIKRWGAKSDNPSAANALIQAAEQSPYLASQFNMLFAKGGSLVVGKSGGDKPCHSLTN